MVRVAIVDDHDVVRFGMRYMLRIDKDMELVAEGANAEDAVRMADEVKPDVLLLDIRMPGTDGTDVLEEVMETNPDLNVMMLTTSDKEEDVYKSVRLGARGYLLKETPAPVMVEAIRAVASGGTWLPEEIMDTYNTRMRSLELTRRDKEILRLVARGMGNGDIARVLSISLDCVKTHVSSILRKMHVSDRAEAVAEGIHRGIIT